MDLHLVCQLCAQKIYTCHPQYLSTNKWIEIAIGKHYASRDSPSQTVLIIEKNPKNKMSIVLHYIYIYIYGFPSNFVYRQILSHSLALRMRPFGFTFALSTIGTLQYMDMTSLFRLVVMRLHKMHIMCSSPLYVDANPTNITTLCNQL
jgi:hypothetical protein